MTQSDITDSRPLYYDLDDNPVDQMTWARLFEGRRDGGRWLVGKTEVPGGVVSTVWLGLDHAYMGSPQIYETLVMGTGLADEMQRYATRAEAIEGHNLMVGRAIASGPVPDSE